MPRNQYSDEFKEQIVKECRQVDNVALVARRHEISKSTVYAWVRKARKNGSVKSLPKDQKKKLKETSKRLEKVSSENDQLKKILAEKELELAVLRDLRDQSDPQ